MRRKTAGPVEQRPDPIGHRTDVGRHTNGLRRQRDGGVRVVCAHRHRAVAERQYRGVRAVHHCGVRAGRPDRGQVRPAATVHRVVRGHVHMPRDLDRPDVDGEPGKRRLSSAGRSLRRRVLHQHRAHTARVHSPVRVLPVRHPRSGQLRGRVRHHADVHPHVENLPARHGRVRQTDQFHRVRRSDVLRGAFLLFLGARNEGHVVPADPDRLRDVHVARQKIRQKIQYKLQNRVLPDLIVTLLAMTRLPLRRWFRFRAEVKIDNVNIRARAFIILFLI